LKEKVTKLQFLLVAIAFCGVAILCLSKKPSE